MPIVLLYRFRFQGQYHDEETGLYYNRFRYYFSGRGDVMRGQQDPIGLSAGKLNLYSYVDEPNGFTDPLGLGECGFEAINKKK